MRAVLRRLLPGVLAMALFLAIGGVARAGAQSATTAPAAVSAISTTAVRTGDAASSRTVNRVVLALLALAGLLAIITVWLWRTTKPKPNHLDGLDAMGSRRWRAATPERRAAILAPVHLRRGEIRDDDLVAAPEPVDTPDAAAVDEAVVAEPEAAALEPVAEPASEPAADHDRATSTVEPEDADVPAPPAEPSDEPAA